MGDWGELGIDVVKRFVFGAMVDSMHPLEAVAFEKKAVLEVTFVDFRSRSLVLRAELEGSVLVLI